MMCLGFGMARYHFHGPMKSKHDISDETPIQDEYTLQYPD